MSGEIINLRRVKKALARAETKKLAVENRVKFGLNKAETTIATFEKVRELKNHRDHKLKK